MPTPETTAARAQECPEGGSHVPMTDDNGVTCRYCRTPLPNVRDNLQRSTATGRHRAEDAERTGEGICRTCLAPIWNEGGTVGRRHHPEGWSDRIERGGDSLVCFKAVDYRHVPLTGREACIYDQAFTRGASLEVVSE